MTNKNIVTLSGLRKGQYLSLTSVSWFIHLPKYFSIISVMPAFLKTFSLHVVVQVPPTDQKISEATPPQEEAESAQSDASVDVSSQQPDPVMATPVPTMETRTPVADKVFPPPVEKLTPANPLAQTASTPLIGNIPPPVEKLTPANPLPQTASTPLIGNIPPQAVEGLKAASQQAASILPLEPTQVFEVL